MAKDTGVDQGLFSKTENEETQEYTKEQRKVNPKGVGLRQYEWDEIEQIAEEIGGDVTGHGVAVYLLRWALGQYKAGKVQLETEKKTTLGEPPSD